MPGICEALGSLPGTACPPPQHGGKHPTPCATLCYPSSIKSPDRTELAAWPPSLRPHPTELRRHISSYISLGSQVSWVTQYYFYSWKETSKPQMVEAPGLRAGQTAGGQVEILTMWCRRLFRSHSRNVRWKEAMLRSNRSECLPKNSRTSSMVFREKGSEGAEGSSERDRWSN